MLVPHIVAFFFGVQLLFSPMAMASTGLCSYLLGFARIDQNSFEVRKTGLFSDDGRSNVCGPACLVGISGKIRAHTARPVLNPVAELSLVMAESAAATAVTAADIRNTGMLAYDLAAMARDHFARRGISADVAVHGAEMSAETTTSISHIHQRTPILPEHLRMGPGEFVLLNYEGWKVWNLDEYGPFNADAGWLNGHWVILTDLSGPGPDGSYEGWILDPIGDETSRVVLKPHYSNYLSIETFEIHSRDSARLRGDVRGTRTSLVTNIVRVKTL